MKTFKVTISNEASNYANSPRMTSNEIYARVKGNEFCNAPTHRVNIIDENGVIRLSRPCWGLDMAESIAADRDGEFDGWTVEIVEQENCDEIQTYLDRENAVRLLTLYLDNTAEIYRRYTQRAVTYVRGLLAFGTAGAVENWMLSGAKVDGVDVIGSAVACARREVERRECVAVPAAAVAAATRDYLANIIEEAEYVKDEITL